MPYPIIDSKSDTKKFNHFPFSETVNTTIDLLELSTGKFAVNYRADYSGIKGGQLSGGPINIPGNGNYIENNDPKVTMMVSNYSDSGLVISMQLTITIDAPVIGTVTIFDQMLGGKYGVISLTSIVKDLERFYE
jgi:hypothetical protein